MWFTAKAPDSFVHHLLHYLCSCFLPLIPSPHLCLSHCFPPSCGVFVLECCRWATTCPRGAAAQLSVGSHSDGSDDVWHGWWLVRRTGQMWPTARQTAAVGYSRVAVNGAMEAWQVNPDTTTCAPQPGLFSDTRASFICFELKLIRKCQFLYTVT